MRCRFWIMAASAAVLAGCRTVDDVIVDYRGDVSSGRYAKAAEELRKLAEKNNEDALRWHLMAATADYLSGDTVSAVEGFDKAEDMMLANDRSSVFARGAAAAQAMMVNDRYFPYDGGGQDRIFACMYKAIGYASAGDKAGARTEFNRAAEHQENWLYERRRDLAAAADRLDKASTEYARERSRGADNSGLSKLAVQNAVRDGSFRESVREAFGIDIFKSSTLNDLKPIDYQNPYCAHLCGVFRWLAGDGGREYLKNAMELRPGNAYVRRDFSSCSQGWKPHGQVWVYVEDGLCPTREPWRIDLPLALIPYAGKYVKYAGIALPRLIENPSAASSWTVDGRGMQVLADVDSLLKIEYDVYMRGAVKREVTRTIVDVGIQAALGITAEHVNDSNTQLALMASQWLVAGYSAARRGADTRCWPSLPKTVYVARVPRPADGVVRISGDGVNVAEVTVPEGNAIVFVRKPSAAAIPAVRTLSF